MKEDHQQQIGLGCSVPPLWQHVLIYFIQQDQTAAHAKEFFDYYSKRKWLNSGSALIKNWKVIAWQWIWHSKPVAHD